MRALVALVLLPAIAAGEGARTVSERDAMDGKAAYLRECSACHGERGDGKGPGAAFVDPAPRNFTKGVFKLRTTESGEPPATADILRTIERGIPGSAMPSYAFLPEDERRQIGAYVLYLADLLDAPEPATIPEPGLAPDVTAESVARGKAVYELMQCWDCHGKLGKGDGPSAKNQRDDDGKLIPVRDFTGGVFRGGGERVDLYYRFVTGMDGSTMPSFGDSVSGDDRWALVDYVMSLRVEPKPQPLPKDALKAGRVLAAKYACRACHVLDDGKGGEVGPDLRLSGRKLHSDWVSAFLGAPREAGKIYPWRVQRMPHLGLAPAEVEVLTRYVAAMGKRKGGDKAPPDPATFAAAALDEGKNLYVLRCTECHTLGTVIETPLAKQQGPDLIRVKDRVDFEWAHAWILDPKKIDPKTKMTVPGLTPAQVDAVRMFIWKTSMESASLR